MSKKPIRKAIIAAAGFGTRFLPQTKALPKEMLPLIDKPIIQYIVEELVGAGIEDIIIVTGYHKRAIEDHFDQISADLRQNLENGGKLKLLEETKKISDLANFVYIRQKGPYGNATPLINAQHLIGDEPFIYAFADDFVEATPTRFQQLVTVYENMGGQVLTCIQSEKDEDYKRYAFVNGSSVAQGIMKVNKIVEKPGKKELAPSSIASVGGYILDPELFSYLEKQKNNLPEGSEFNMQEALQVMMNEGKDVFAVEIQNGTYHDTGNKLEYIKTVIDFSLRDPNYGSHILEHIKNYLK